MDTSKTYIKMRLAAIPDLGMGIPPQLPTYFFTETEWVDVKGDWYYSTNDECCQLERQDQLQPMCEYGDSPPSMIHLLHDFMETQYPQTKEDIEYGDASLAEIIFDSWEQLWLSFIMKEKYNKVWDGEKYVIK